VTTIILQVAPINILLQSREGIFILQRAEFNRYLDVVPFFHELVANYSRVEGDDRP